MPKIIHLAQNIAPGRDDEFSWHGEQEDQGNLRGTARTLDNCDGDWQMAENRRLRLQPGVLSRAGWTVVDDTASLVLSPEGLPVPRQAAAGYRDLYFLGYGARYQQCLRDYFRLTGFPPLLPKWALGLWWSRWEKYTDDDLRGIVASFAAHGLPLSVLVIDMDWHLVENPYTNGWTGFSWNPAFFRDPPEFFQWLHGQDIHACLNLHPADGVQPHETRYAAMAAHMGIDPASMQPIPFDIADPRFIAGYFQQMLHPLEADGVDFWWMDWQQQAHTRVAGLDPLWALNHLHAGDLARDGRKRPLVFSRWGDRGAHRYPIGFSGDSYRTWATLAFEVYFTATAANDGFGWWSHDLGGFARGGHDDELYLRWVQFGCLSPIFRLHNCGDPTLDYRPWSKSAPIADAAMAAMALRRRLLPYLYTAAWKHHGGGPALCAPLYHYHLQAEEAYLCPQAYYFGASLIAAPYTQPADDSTRLSRQTLWLPEGEWFDFQSGQSYTGGRFLSVYGDFAHMPLFATAGAIIPLAGETAEEIEFLSFPGESGTGELYDDDGASMAYADNVCRKYSVNPIDFPT